MTGLRRRLTGVALALLASASPLVAAALPAGVPGGPTSAAAAATAVRPAAGPAPAAPAAPLVAVQIDSVSPTVLEPGQDLTVTATLTNQTGKQLDGVFADLRLNRFRPASRADLEGWVTGSSGAVGTWVVNTGSLSIPPGGQTTVTLTLPASGVRLSTLAGSWGPRGLAVEAVMDGSRVGIQRTFLLWMFDQVVPQVQVGLLAPVTGTAGDLAALTQATGQGGRLAALGALAQAEPDVEMAADPALLAAATADGGGAKAWAQQLTAALARRDTFALPWGDLDLGAVAHAGRPELLSAAMALSASSDLARINARTDVVWAPDGTLDRPTVDAAAAAGARAIVVGPTTLQSDEGAATAPVALDTGHGSLAALVPDGVLTDLFTAPDEVQAGATTATTVQRMLAELAVLAHDGSTRPHDVLIAPGRTWTPDPVLVGALMDALRSSPWSRIVPVSALLGAEGEGTPRAALAASAVDPGELAPGEVRALADSRDATIAFAHAIGDGGTLTAGLDETVLAPLSVAWRADPTGREALVQKALAATTAARTGLSLRRPPSLNVISSAAPVRFVVHNALKVPATVSVAVAPHKACLQPARSGTVTAEPGTDTSVVVNLTAIANCDVQVDARLVGQDGTTVSSSVGFSARVAPTIENVGTVVIGALLALGLVLGIVRTVRRGQSARRGDRHVPDATPAPPVLGGPIPSGDPALSTGATDPAAPPDATARPDTPAPTDHRAPTDAPAAHDDEA